MDRRLTLLLAIALFVGCSEQSNRPKTYSATGTVTLNGTPLEGATVNFYPMEGTGSSIGLTDASGKYSLTTFRSEDGALPGQYKVSITKYEGAAPKSGASPAEGQLASGEIDMLNYAPPTDSPAATSLTGPKNLVPAKYSNADTSTLRGMVDESGSSENNFDLK